jgi:hypothetical protein
MSWNRAAAAAAITAVLQTAMGETVFVYPKPPGTVNPPAVIVGRPASVRYSTVAFTIDEAILPVSCCGPADGDDMVDALVTAVRHALTADQTLGGAVQACWPADERAWRQASIAGVDVLLADVNLTVQM